MHTQPNLPTLHTMTSEQKGITVTISLDGLCREEQQFMIRTLKEDPLMARLIIEFGAFVLRDDAAKRGETITCTPTPGATITVTPSPLRCPQPDDVAEGVQEEDVREEEVREEE